MTQCLNYWDEMIKLLELILYREHNRIEIEKHLMFKRITIIEGSSTDKRIIESIRQIAEEKMY
jgi:cephalosporin hydroxylase